MKRIPPYLKNKFVLATTVFFIYALFLDENDIFTLVSQSHKLSGLEKAKNEVQEKLDDTSITLNKLKYSSEVKRFAREKKYFKEDDEDIFVISYE